MKLSIIIPYYNAKEYTDELLDCLDKQMNDDVEVILVDDGSKEPYKTDYEWCTVIRQRNKRCAGARNTGLDLAKGDYIQFIDADDMVPDYFIKRLFQEMKIPFDVCDFSWKSLSKEGVQHNRILRSREDRLTNPSVCTRCFSRAYIGKNRFNTKKDSTEDEDFSRKLGYLTNPCKHTAISEYMYFYRTDVENSKIKRFKQGLMNTKRIVYHYNHVTEDMDWLLKEIKKEDERNEVWLLTSQNDIPELRRYCQISPPIQIWAHELRGEPYGRCAIIEAPITAQVVIYCEHCATVGGISTVIFNFCHFLNKYYDIIVFYEKMDDLQITKLSNIVQVMKWEADLNIVCDTLILNRLTDKIKSNITFKKSIQICHACRQINFRIPKDRDILVNVSEAAKESWGEESEEGIVIHNMVKTEHHNCLLLVSATRVNTMDKGQNDQRMRKLAEMLDGAGIKYLWFNFADGQLKNMPPTFINMPAMANIHPFIEKADYLVQLSDAEAYSMSVLEALSLNTAVIATPFPSLFEEGFEDGKTGYAVPFDMKFDVKKLLDVPEFEFEYDNKAIIRQWREILGDKKPKKTYKPKKLVNIVCTHKYHDTELSRIVRVGEYLKVTEQRAAHICGAGFGRRV